MLLSAVVYCLAVLVTAFLTLRLSVAIFVMALVFGFISGLLDVSALVFSFTWIVISLLFQHRFTLRLWVKTGLIMLWVLMAAALITHNAPGFNNVLLVENIALKPGSLVQNFYWNLDKILIVWSLALHIPILKKSAPFPTNSSMIAVNLLVILACFITLFGLGMFFGLVSWQPGFFEFAWILLLANLVNTCFAEELLFRGILQRFLMKQFNPWLGLILSGAIFGLAHIGGGFAFMLVATLAGILYGYVFWQTGRIIWAILVHFAFNASHMLLFTYPLSVI